MRRFPIAFVLAVLAVGGALAVRGFADEPATLTEDESARVRHLIDDLGSDDFRVREGAQKALASFGPRVLPALRAAASHDSAEVRFRAEQLVRSIEGAPAEKPLGRDDDGGATSGNPLGRRRGDLFGRDRRDLEREVERLLEESKALSERMRRHFREMEEEMRKGGTGLDTRFPGFDFGLGARREGVFESGSGDRDARLVVKPDGVRLAVREKAEGGGMKETRVVEAKDLAELRTKLDEQPDLRDQPDVASVVKQAGLIRLRMPEFRFDSTPLERYFRDLRPGVQSKVVMNGVQIEQVPGKTTVTVTEDGPDGKPVTKTYEGADLDTIKREHPEVAERLGGLRIEIGPGSPGGLNQEWLRRFLRRRSVPPAPPLDGGAKSGKDDDDEMDDDDLEEEGELKEEDLKEDSDETGPFGLQIAPVEPVLREYLGLAEGTGARVRVVRPDSAAARLGLKPGDIVVGVKVAGIEGKNAEVENASPDAIANALRGAEKGGSLSVDVIRAGRPLKLTR